LWGDVVFPRAAFTGDANKAAYQLQSRLDRVKGHIRHLYRSGRDQLHAPGPLALHFREKWSKEDTAEHVRLTGREIHTQCALCLTKVRPASPEEVGWTQAKCPYGGTTKALSQAIQQLHAARLERQDLERQLQFHAGYGLQAGLARLVSTPEPD